MRGNGSSLVHLAWTNWAEWSFSMLCNSLTFVPSKMCNLQHWNVLHELWHKEGEES